MFFFFVLCACAKVAAMEKLRSRWVTDPLFWLLIGPQT